MNKAKIDRPDGNFGILHEMNHVFADRARLLLLLLLVAGMGVMFCVCNCVCTCVARRLFRMMAL
jgi:hypothetical protein